VTSPGNIDPTPIKIALANEYAVATGTSNGDWSKILQTYTQRNLLDQAIYGKSTDTLILTNSRTARSEDSTVQTHGEDVGASGFHTL